MKSLVRFCLILTVVLGSLATANGQIVLLGNLPSNDLGSRTIDANNVKAIKFTMPAAAYTIDSVTLRLLNYSTPTDIPSVGFYADGGTAPGSLVGSLFTNPSSASDAVSDFSFVSAGTVTLSANTTYWLVVADISAGLGFDWRSSSPVSTPTGLASYLAAPHETPIGTWNMASGNITSFQINATAVPEPSTYAALVGLGALALAAFRQRRR